MVSCKKNGGFEKATNLSYSNQLIRFDTVINTISSETKRFLIYNKSSSSVLIKNIYLKHGSASVFRLNIDGVADDTFKDFHIRSNDSVYAFVEFTSNPTNTNAPFLITDSIVINTHDNNLEYVALEAVGQDAHYFFGRKITPALPPLSCLDGDCQNGAAPVTIRWTNDKPYVIFDYLVIDSLDKLIIEPGVKVYFYNNSGLWVFRGGNIEVNGQDFNPVVFQGTRLGKGFENVSGQWDRIIINEGTKPNVFNNAIIKNGYIGIQAEPFNNPNEKQTNALILNRCVLKNHSLANLYLTNSTVESRNTVFSNSAVYSVFLQGNNTVDFRHTTIANYWNGNVRSTPAVSISNTYKYANTKYIYDIDSIGFYNTIITGTNRDEINITIEDNKLARYGFYGCAIKTDDEITNNNRFSKTSINPPLNTFLDVFNQNYELTRNSVATLDLGIPRFRLTTDITGKIRSDSKPDIGAYEF